MSSGWVRTAVGAVLTLAAAAPSVLGAQDSRCADCHLANPDAPDLGHLIDWEHSAHGRSGIGCESCHGGDPSTFERTRAHLGILRSTDAASFIHRANLPETCGKCHPGPFVAFQKSRHHALLLEGDRAVPVCTTCHGDVGAHLLSPRALEARCRGCHGKDGSAPEHPEFAVEGRELLERVGQVRALLEQAKPLVRRIREDERRARFENDLEQALVPLREAVDAGHSFVFAALEERLTLARSRAEALLESLANPAPVR